MKILHVSTYDSGGAANAMLTLHNSLLKNGESSRVLVLYNYKKHEGVVSFLESRNFHARVKDSFKYRLFNLKRSLYQKLYSIDNQFTFFNGPYSLLNHPLYKWADVINLHWYSNFINLTEVLLKSSKPIVFTLHDENFFLGGYHYSFDRQNALSKAKNFDLKLQKEKEKLLKKKNSIYLVTPSKWLYNMSKKVYKQVYHIPYGIDTTLFRTIDKYVCREKLGIEKNQTVYLLLADDLKSKRKGGNETLQAFIDANQENALLLIAGNFQDQKIHDKIRYLGYITGNDGLSEVYSSADVFINPTLADNLPNTVLESLACGTPVIGFDTGGMKDMIDPSNGVLLTPLDFKCIFQKKHMDTVKKSSKETIVNGVKKKFDIELQYLNYINLYNHAISNYDNTNRGASLE